LPFFRQKNIIENHSIEPCLTGKVGISVHEHSNDSLTLLDTVWAVITYFWQKMAI
jgi:hypothetical protein